MTTPKRPQLTVTMTMDQLTTLRAALDALWNAAYTTTSAQRAFARSKAEANLRESHCAEIQERIEAAGRALDAAILPTDEWEALTDDLEAVRALKTDFDFAASENERLAGAVLPSMKGGRHE